MGADSFKSQGIQLQLGGARRMGGPALGPQNGGVPIVQQGEPTAPPAARTPVFSVSPSTPASNQTQPTAPLGGSKIPSMRKSQAGGGARDAFTPAGQGAQVRLAGGPQAPIQTEPAPQLDRRPAPQPQPQPAAELAGAEQVVLCEAIAEMPDGQQWAAPYEAVFPAGAKFLGVRTTKR